MCGLQLGIRMVSTSSTASSRYERGIKKLDPVKVAAIQGVLAKNPSITQAELARRVGLSKAGLTYYLRGLRAELDAAAAKNTALRARQSETQVDLAEMIASLAERMRREAFELLDKRPNDLQAKGTAARLATACAQLARASGALSGRTGPANVHIAQLQALLLSPLDASKLSPAARVVVEAGHDSGSDTR